MELTSKKCSCPFPRPSKIRICTALCPEQSTLSYAGEYLGHLLKSTESRPDCNGPAVLNQLQTELQPRLKAPDALPLFISSLNCSLTSVFPFKYHATIQKHLHSMLLCTRIGCYQIKVAECKDYMEVYAEGMAKQAFSRHHLLFMFLYTAPPSSYTFTSGESLLQLLLLYFPSFSCRTTELLEETRPLKACCFLTCFFRSSLPTFKLIFRANELSIACLHSTEPLEGRINQADNQGLSQQRGSFKNQADTEKVIEGTKACCSCPQQYLLLLPAH